jgi:hypothetical protein
MEEPPPPVPAGWARGAGNKGWVHTASGLTLTTLAQHFPGRFPPYYNHSGRMWVSVAPSGSPSTVAVLGPAGEIPAPLQKLIAATETKTKVLGPAPVAARLPVKMDRPLPKLPPGWSEAFRDGDYVKFEHKHSKTACSQLVMEEVEAGFQPTYYNFASQKRTTVRPTESAKCVIIAAAPPPPPNVPKPNMPRGWLKTYLQRTDDFPHFQEFKTGRVVEFLYLEEPEIGANKTHCYYDFAHEERLTLPPLLGADDLVVDKAGGPVEVVQAHEYQHVEEDDSEHYATAFGKGKVTAKIAAGTVASARSAFGGTAGGFDRARLQAARGAGAGAGPSTAAAEAEAAAAAAEAAAEAGAAEAEAAATTLPPVPPGWTRGADDDGDTFFLRDADGTAVWVLWLEAVDDDTGEKYWWNCGTGEAVAVRPDVADDDAACAIVGSDGERVYGGDGSGLGGGGAEPETPDASPVEGELPDGWTEVTDEEGSTYFFHEATGEAVWERPGA